jgi:predicted ATPase
MITSLHVQNFKCLRDVTITFEPLTVLIGPNDSGKTSILDALRVLPSVSNANWLSMLGISDEQVVAWRRRKESLPIRWEVQGRLDQEERVYAWPRADSRRTDTEEEQTLLRVLGTSQILRLDPDALRKAAVPQAKTVLSPSGDNLAAVLDRLIAGPDRSAIAHLESALHDAVPTLRGVALPAAAGGPPGAKILEFVLAGDERPPVTIPCGLASDGAMLLTAFLALAYTDTPELLFIEQPEDGLHPSRLKSVIDLLRKMTTGEVGNRPRQIILTTHSPLLLNFARPEEIRILQRDPETGTKVTTMADVPDIHALLDEFGAGELWYLLGEKALVEGKKP